MAESLTDVDVLGVEFNHDVAMQKSSRRPEFLIERNLGDDGHLSNIQGAELLEAVLDAVARAVAAPRGAAAPERAVQSARPGDRGRPGRPPHGRAASRRPRRAAKPALFRISWSLPAATGPCRSPRRRTDPTSGESEHATGCQRRLAG